jgi:putative transcriptional regulator
MIRIKLKEALAEKEFQEKRTITLGEVAKDTGIHRVTLSKIGNDHSYNPGLDLIDRLLTYFKCDINDLLVHLPNE